MSREIPPTTTPTAGVAADAETGGGVAGVVKSDGQRLLAAVRSTAPEIGREVGASKQTIAYWRNGKKLPGAEMRTKLEERYGIPAASWDVAPGDVAARSSGTPPAAAEPIDRIDREIAYVERIAHDENLAPSVRVRYQVELNKLIVEAQKRDQREAALLQNPRVRRVLVTIVEAVAPWPDAFKAARDAVSRLRAEETPT